MDGPHNEDIRVFYLNYNIGVENASLKMVR
jgi:hypothetical protein